MNTAACLVCGVRSPTVDMHRWTDAVRDLDVWTCPGHPAPDIEQAIILDRQRARRHPPKRRSARPRWALGWRRQFDLVRSSDGRTYLTRWWLIATPLFGVCVHRMTAPDARVAVHDHPFGFVSIVLRGGYRELTRHPRTLELRERTVRGLNVMRTRRAHTITHLLRIPTWTLLLVGRQQATWGFWERDDDAEFAERGAAWLWVRHDAFDTGVYVAQDRG